MPEPNKVLSLNELERFLEADVAWEVEDVESFRDSPKYQLKLLMKLSLSKTEMKKRGFIVDPLQPGDIQAKKRCDVCHKQIGNFKRLKFDDGGMPIVTSNGFLKEPSMACKYHDGVVQNKKWTCCKKSAYEGTKPCKGAQEHKPHIYAKDELETLWKFVPTPSTHSKSAEHHAAVAVDCEMGISELGDSELIRVTLVDYFTSEVLIDELVYPDVQMKHLNTRFSGVTWAQLDQARRRGDCLVGRQAARECVFNFVGPSTVIIGHSVENDLKALRWIHHRVVDTFTLERRIWDEEQNNMIASQAMIEIHSTEKSSPKNMPPKEPKTPKLKGSGSLSLKTVTSIRLGRNIQQRGGHDSKEDAIAARDIARWHVLNSNVSLFENFKGISLTIHSINDFW
jgi:DNA polymerase III epsilon subunit-like protein